MDKLKIRNCVGLDGKEYHVDDVPDGINVITFCDMVFIRGGTLAFHQVETHKTRTLHHGLK